MVCSSQIRSPLSLASCFTPLNSHWQKQDPPDTCLAGRCGDSEAVIWKQEETVNKWITLDHPNEIIPDLCVAATNGDFYNILRLLTMYLLSVKNLQCLMKNMILIFFSPQVHLMYTDFFFLFFIPLRTENQFNGSD